MIDTNPARALNVVKRVVEMCDFIEHPAIKETIEQKMVPRPLPPAVNAVVDISVWVGLGTVGLWAALDAFAERADFQSQGQPNAPPAKDRGASRPGSPVTLRATRVGASRSWKTTPLKAMQSDPR